MVKEKYLGFDSAPQGHPWSQFLVPHQRQLISPPGSLVASQRARTHGATSFPGSQVLWEKEKCPQGEMPPHGSGAFL